MLRAMNVMFPCRRRQWSLVDTDHMRYCQLNAWDKAMMELDNKYSFMSSPTQWVTTIDQEKQVIVVHSFVHTVDAAKASMCHRAA